MATTTPSMQVCMDTSDYWFKGIVNSDTVSLDNSSTSSPSAIDLLSCAKPSQPLLERRLRPPHDHALKCPRCDSTHTKFCYYNNYSLSQPRYFCKTCRRYWTKGGSLRNVPVGGGCRKNKRSSAVKKPSELQPTMRNCVSVHHQMPHQPLIDLQLFSSCEIGMGESGYNGMMLNSMGFPIVEEMHEAEVKPGNKMLSLEWPEQGCGDMYGYGALWTGMMNGNVHGHGPSSAAM